MKIWDSSGEETYRSVTEIYCSGCKGAFIFYDITNAQTYAQVPKWIEWVQESSSKGLHVMLVGTKADEQQNRQISTKEGQGLADLHHFLFMETSAKNMLNVEEMFMRMTETLVNNVR
uniref:Uncharacterized protein n=1 Tax=Arcella intermedia TaxID=1963864 RepID=A0A6B2LRR4_9EUKA